MGASFNSLNDCLIVTVSSEITEQSLNQLREETLSKVTEGKQVGVIFDFCSVQILDSHEFEQIIDLSHMIHYLGSEAVVVGLQPGVVAALVDMAIDSKGVKTFLNMESGLKYFEPIDAELNEALDEDDPEEDFEGDEDAI